MVPITRTSSSTSTTYQSTSLLVQSTKTVGVDHGSVTLNYCFQLAADEFLAVAGVVYVVTPLPPKGTVGFVDNSSWAALATGVASVMGGGGSYEDFCSAVYTAITGQGSFQLFDNGGVLTMNFPNPVINNTWTAPYTRYYTLIFYQPINSHPRATFDFEVSVMQVSMALAATTSRRVLR
ncbi:MAG: hypothetical protein WB643_12365 [Candidatus Bathyarchaeia archaeon]